MPRALHIGKYYQPFTGGIENFMGSLLPALAPHGVTASAFAHQHEHFKPYETKVVNGVRVYLTPSYGRLLFAPLSPLFPIHLKRVVREFKPDVIHIHLPNLSAFWLLANVVCRRIPWVIHWHADVLTTRQPWYFGLVYRVFYRFFERRLLEHSRVIIATSPPYLDASVPLAPFRDKCVVIPLGLEDVAEETTDHADPVFDVLAIGRLTYYKGFNNLIRAGGNLDGVKVEIIGSGDEHESLMQLMTDLGTENVTLSGFQENSMVATRLATCDVVCLPSIERTEAFGVVLLEAMRAGKAVIASDIDGSGIGWVVRNDNTGLLVSPGSVGPLRNAIIRLRDDPTLTHALGQSGRKRFEEDFSITSIASMTSDLYDRIIAHV